MYILSSCFFFVFKHFNFFFFFFFQAEDGIRDRTVTGVQTCALPIWVTAVGRSVINGKARCVDCAPREELAPIIVLQGLVRVMHHGVVEVCARHGMLGRSEERRVGKECRWWGEGGERK